MCIRDSRRGGHHGQYAQEGGRVHAHQPADANHRAAKCGGCLLYTSDAADERSSVDLGGRRIIKKKKRLERSGKQA
mgnify:CR=1 FL=1